MCSEFIDSVFEYSGLFKGVYYEIVKDGFELVY